MLFAWVQFRPGSSKLQQGIEVSIHLLRVITLTLLYFLINGTFAMRIQCHWPTIEVSIHLLRVITLTLLYFLINGTFAMRIQCHWPTIPAGCVPGRIVSVESWQPRHWPTTPGGVHCVAADAGVMRMALVDGAPAQDRQRRCRQPKSRVFPHPPAVLMALRPHLI